MTFGTNRNINIASHRAFLHFTVRNAYITHNKLQLFHILSYLVYRAEIRLGNNLDKRHAATVIVNIGISLLVNKLTCVLFNVNTVKSYSSAAAKLYISVFAQRLVIL